MKLKKLFLFVCIVCSSLLCKEMQGQELKPMTRQFALLWKTTNDNGVCWNDDDTAKCSVTICLGESVCFMYEAPFPDSNNYAGNHRVQAFSDGGSIVIENVSYNGPNQIGYVCYTPTATGVITTSNQPGQGIIATPLIINVVPAAPPVLSANITPNGPGCAENNFCLESLTSPIISYSFTSATALATCPPSAPCINNTMCFPPGQHEIVYTVNAGHPCEAKQVYTVTVVEPTVTITTIPPATCSSQYCFTATANCNLLNTIYTWYITSSNNPSFSQQYYPTNTTNSLCVDLPPGQYNVSVSIGRYGGNVSGSTDLNVPILNTCQCFTCTPLVTNGNLSVSPSPGQYCINSDLTISGNVSFINSEFKITPGVLITVSPGAQLTIDHSRLFSYGGMWKGISVQNGGSINVINNSLIEDASGAVTIVQSTLTTQVLNIDNSTFNKNMIDVIISDYNQTVSPLPFRIYNSLFTCRDLGDCGTLGWPTTSTVKLSAGRNVSPNASRYIDNIAYPPTNIIAGGKSRTGIRLQNVRTTTLNGSNYVYTDLQIGDVSGTDTFNMFDNHSIGIDANNSNIDVKNAIFQEGWDPHITIPSYGIKATSSSKFINRVVSNSWGTTNINRFFDLSRGIKLQEIFEADLQYNYIASSRLYNPQIPTQKGAYGVEIVTSRYNLIQVNSNQIYNVDNGVDFKASFGPSNVYNQPIASGQYFGELRVDNNSISSSSPTSGRDNEPPVFGVKAITITGLSGGMFIKAPNYGIHTVGNIINDYVNGIACSNFPAHRIETVNNTIGMTAGRNGPQYGIKHSRNGLMLSDWAFGHSGIAENQVYNAGNGTTGASYGIHSIMNFNYPVTCNTVTDVWNGIAFSGYHYDNLYSKFNIMQGNMEGWKLENQARLGIQGNITNMEVADNKWLGNFTNGFAYKTSVINSNAQFSKMIVRNLPQHDPNGSCLLSSGSPGVQDYSHQAGTIIPITGPTIDLWCFLTKPGKDELDADRITDKDRLDVKPLENLLVDSDDNRGVPVKVMEVNKTELYNLLAANDELVSRSEILADFYNRQSGTYRNIYFTIETKLTEGNYEEAANLNNAYRPRNSAEEKHKQLITYMLKYQDVGSLTDAEQVNLLSIANSCPYTEGGMVFEARALYNLATGQSVEFTENCQYGDTTRKSSLENAVSGIEEGEQITLYPNPSNGEEVFITLQSSDIKTVEVNITTISGLEVGKEVVTLTSRTGKLNMSLRDGVYLLIVTDPNSDYRVVKKLIIQK